MGEKSGSILVGEDKQKDDLNSDEGVSSEHFRVSNVKVSYFVIHISFRNDNC